MARYLLILVAGTSVLTGGYVNGLLTGRWHETKDLSAAAARLDRIPLVIGDWQGEALELNPRTVQQAGFNGYVLRRYKNQHSGAIVSLLVACGQPGPLSVHTPEVCYGGAGFRLLAGGSTRETLEAGSGRINPEIFKATFARDQAAAPEQLRVVWSWCKNGAWTAPENPRWKFAGTSVLYKLYVTQTYFPRDDATDGESCVDFFRELLPEMDKVLANAG